MVVMGDSSVLGEGTVGLLAHTVHKIKVKRTPRGDDEHPFYGNETLLAV
jgi:hypothetical protein